MRFTWRRRYVLTAAEVAMSNELPANYRFTVHSWFCSKNDLFRAVSYGRVSAAAAPIVQGITALVCWLVLRNSPPP